MALICFLLLHLAGPLFDREEEEEVKEGDEDAALPQWLQRAIDSKDGLVRMEAERHLTRKLLSGDLLKAPGGCSQEAAILKLSKLKSLEHAASDYLFSARKQQQRKVLLGHLKGNSAEQDTKGGEGEGEPQASGFLEDHVLYKFVYNQVVGLQRADILEWMLLHGPASLILDEGPIASLGVRCGSGGDGCEGSDDGGSCKAGAFIQREEARRVSERFGFGADLPAPLAGAFDKADRMKSMRRDLEGIRCSFGLIIGGTWATYCGTAEGSVECCDSCCQHIAEFRAAVPDGLVDSDILRDTATGESLLVDPAVSTSCPGLGGARPLCKVAELGGGKEAERLAEWIWDVKTSDDDKPNACFQAFVVAAMNGNAGVAKVRKG